VEGSTKFLLHMGESLDLTVQERKGGGDAKGKSPIGTGTVLRDTGPYGNSKQRWEPPPTGWVKLNTDITFCKVTRETSLGIVMQDSEGKVVLTTWRELAGCGLPEQAEAEACLEGMRLSVEWIRQPMLVETDC
jgi:hypothetical protein